MLRSALGRVGNIFNRGVSTFNTRIFPKAVRTIGSVATVGRNIGEASKAVRNIGSAINSISGNRLSQYADKANEVMSKIEGVGNELSSAERPLLQGLNTIQRKINS
jgi:hypothetical protein